ncbi:MULTISPECIES: DUF2500 domain-containing protein [Catenibacterium]|uniref:DUF2500 domain-containing protein n=1 Tax=Catenibacterium sp. UBA627 TaxID=1946309 RepID=UPI00242C6070|nr:MULTISPECIES: DUF2500 domain-containing protein [Catenibacterium]
MFDLMFTIVPVLVIGMFIYVIVSGIGSWHKNNNSPRLSVPVKIVTKRADTMYTHHEDMMSSSHTTYYVTFEVESGDRIEPVVPSSEYGFMVEGDQRKLTFQGTRYISFDRNY